MAYLVLARKWRPQGFDAIRGQEHVTRTLKNAIEQDRVHHAFLFCGARGVGKTTAARVLARALNCRRDDGPTTDPCGTCEACTEIAQGTAVDVFEIDGASNRGINEIRELRDGVAYAPQRDRFKIYIIDEVHMLTTEAFNALLKTLEEPPAHVKFIFATTEPHKIPVTILSRCQRFDFKRISREVMSAYLAKMLASEGVNIGADALGLVARESEGSMRDALSLLDRIISFCGNEASYDDVAGVLGVADRSWLNRLVVAALDKDTARGMGVVEEAFNFGLDLRQFATDLVHYLRDIVVLKVAGEGAGLTDLSEEETQALVVLGKSHAVEDLQRMLTVVIKAAERLAHANFPRLEMEMAVIRLCTMRPLRPMDALVQRLQAIERRLESGAPLPPLQPGGSPSPKPEARAGAALAAPGRLDGAASSALSPPQEQGPAVSLASARPLTSSASPALCAPAHQAPTPLARSQAGGHAAVSEGPRADVASSGAPPTLQTKALLAPVPAPTPAPTPTLQTKPTPAPPTESNPAPLPGPIPTSESADSFSADDWEALCVVLRGVSPQLGASADHATVLGVADGIVRVTFAGTASHRLARQDEETIAAHISGFRPGICGFQIVDHVQDGDDTPFRRRQRRAQVVREAKLEALAAHPLVLDVVERFSGTLLKTRLYEDH